MKNLVLFLLIFITVPLYARYSKTVKYLLLPVFPYPAWQIDRRATKYTRKNYRIFHTFFDVMIEKGQEGHSGYDLRLSYYKKFFGTYVRYNITSNLELMNKFLDIGLVYRFYPKYHIRPKIELVYKYINCDRLLQAKGLVVSIVNYEYIFNSKYGIILKSFMGAVNYSLYTDLSLYLLYRVYPSITIKLGGAIARAVDINFYTIKLGFSIRL